MIFAKARAAGILLLCGALTGSCDSSPRKAAPAAVPEIAAAAAARAGDPSCRLPLGHFAPSLRQLTGSILSPPTNLVVIDAEGRIRWNSSPVGAERLRDYLGIAAAGERAFLRVYPDPAAPCASVRETLDAAIRIGRCSPERCAFEWPPGNPPPPPDPPVSRN
ncbi:MAG TPA: hypothetical protein VF662_00860 [Allosphingosinicella sp.]|jgi:hypothetical protein